MKPKQVVTIEQKGQGYSIIRIDGKQAIQCERCLHVSYSSGDIANRYCRHCDVFHDDIVDEAEIRRRLAGIEKK